MPGSVASVLSEAEDFETALRQEGCLGLLVASREKFRARLTQVALHRLKLSAGEEQLARIAFMEVPADSVLVTFAIGRAPAPIWAGVEAQANEIITLGPGQMLHARTGGPALWGTLRIPEQEWLDYGAALTGSQFVVPRGIVRWRPRSAAARHLRDLHRAAIRTAETRSAALADAGAVHGLEQQMIGALIKCLGDATAEKEAPAARRYRDVLAEFVELLKAGSFRRTTDICAALGISQQRLRECCRLCLGLSPAEYRRRRAMQQVNRALRSDNYETSTVSEIAERYGFRDLGHFAANYRAIYGELPSVTLRRGSHDGLADLRLGRPRMKLP
jgi:AraC-like DNA-binding protein